MPKHLEQKKKTGTFKKHSVIPARMFNMLPLCLLSWGLLFFLLYAMTPGGKL